MNQGSTWCVQATWIFNNLAYFSQPKHLKREAITEIITNTDSEECTGIPATEFLRTLSFSSNSISSNGATSVGMSYGGNNQAMTPYSKFAPVLDSLTSNFQYYADQATAASWRSSTNFCG
jgi:hypothetical protein